MAPDSEAADVALTVLTVACLLIPWVPSLVFNVPQRPAGSRAAENWQAEAIR